MKETVSSTELSSLSRALKEGSSLLCEGLWDSPKALIAALAAETTGKHVLILSGKSHEEALLFHDFAAFTELPVVDFPAWETLPSEKVPPSPDIVGERYETLQTLLHAPVPHIVISSLQATLQKLIDPSLFKELHFDLKKGEKLPFNTLLERLLEMGYERRPVASDKGEFAVRGGIVDIFPVSSPDPYRIEFWGDEIESLRIYDPIGQKTIRQIEEVQINPAKELELLGKSERHATILDYLGKDTIVIFDDLLALEDRYATLTGMGATGSGYFLSIEELMDLLQGFQTLYWSRGSVDLLSEVKNLGPVQERLQDVSFEMFMRKLSPKRYFHPFLRVANFLFPEADDGLSEEELIDALKDPERAGESWTILAQTESEKKAFLEKLGSLPPFATLKSGYLSAGFALERQVLCPLTEVTHRFRIRRQKQRSTYHTPPTETFHLEPGDMVVHLNQGIGKFLGMERRPDINGVESEFFLLEYAKNAKLFVPMNQAHLITKYIGATDELPKLHELGSSRWQRAKVRTQQAILGYAKDLLDLYAQRSVATGIVCRPDGDDMFVFENEFPYEETKDQLDAIANIKADMCSERIMDRLVCGDVGYGKTEVAMRAAFKAVADGGKQVAVLVPTTVLAMQHYENFTERMRDFPVNVGIVSRFRTPKQVKETLEGVKNGSVDILIGTHRLISKDVEFKDLGLLIIDEEQRFGVRTKEHLKKLKVGVECLTLSATPIPRTLYMSLMGARDLSVINTPPQDRIPIKTVVSEMSDELLKAALMRELARDGQAYVIHNRVESIYELAARIQKLVPQARVIVGHGQMDPKEIDDVFHAFKSGAANVLVATTIVENGIDIPNANTILIDRADRFGLAELYQLRGRVGRWNRKAYAYFLVPKLSTLPELSRKRLEALAGSSGYGGGMKIALRDLEIRGAGNILGQEQSGQVEAIGFHQYCKWLKRAVKTLQGDLSASFADVKVDAQVDARLPDTYINEVTLRMEFYQRLGETTSKDEVDEIEKELIDRFGPLPPTAEWLIALSRVRTQAALKGLTALSVKKVSVTLEKGKESRQLMFKAPTTPADWEKGLIDLINLCIPSSLN